MKDHQKIEDYEEKVPSLKTFFKDVTGDILFVVGGSGKISSASLSILQYLKKHKINILYIKPEMSLLNDTQAQLEKLVYNVFQEYTRSGVFERMYIVANEEVAQIVGDMSIKNYHEKINEMIVSTIHMINVYKNNDSVMDTFCDLPVGTRLTTIGMSDLEKNEDRMFFSLDNVTDIVYYYTHNKGKLESDFGLMSKIKNAVSSKKEDGVRVTYGIFETDYERDYIYCLNHSSVIQK
jgi:predicted CoA-binding protein